MTNQTLVAYFSASGVTAKAASSLAAAIGTDLYEKDLAPSCPGAVIRDGQIMRRGASAEELKRWADKF